MQFLFNSIMVILVCSYIQHMPVMFVCFWIPRCYNKAAGGFHMPLKVPLFFNEHLPRKKCLCFYLPHIWCHNWITCILLYKNILRVVLFRSVLNSTTFSVTNKSVVIEPSLSSKAGIECSLNNLSVQVILMLSSSACPHFLIHRSHLWIAVLASKYHAFQ